MDVLHGAGRLHFGCARELDIHLQGRLFRQDLKLAGRPAHRAVDLTFRPSPALRRHINWALHLSRARAKIDDRPPIFAGLPTHLSSLRLRPSNS